MISFQDRSKPGRQIVTFLLICNLSIWVIYTFEVQKVEESPVQVSGPKRLTLNPIKIKAHYNFGGIKLSFKTRVSIGKVPRF